MTTSRARKVRKNSTSKMPMWVNSCRTAMAMVENDSTAPLIHRQPCKTGFIPNGTNMGRFAPVSSERALKPPFRADQVGSLLRPEALKAAREKYLGPQTPTHAIGPHDNAALRNVEDQCVRDVIAMQERVGLKAVTDGEFRRRSWWLELILGWEGFAADRTGSGTLKWRNESGVTQGFSDLKLTGKIRWRPSSVVNAFVFLRKNTKAVPKVTMPAPNCVHYYMGGEVNQAIYKDKDEFWADLVKAYRQEIEALVGAGAKYI